HEDLRLDAGGQSRLGGHHHRVGDASHLVEDKEHVVRVDTRQGVRLLLGVAVLRPGTGGGEPRLRVLLEEDPLLLPLERFGEELRPLLPLRKLRPQAVLQVSTGDGGADDLRVGPGEEEVPNEHRHHGGLPRPLTSLHGDALMLWESVADVFLPVVELGVEEVPNHLRRVLAPLRELLLGQDVAHSGNTFLSVTSASTTSPSMVFGSVSFFFADFILSMMSSARDFPLLVTSTRSMNIALLLAKASAARSRCDISWLSSRTVRDQNSWSSRRVNTLRFLTSSLVAS